MSTTSTAAADAETCAIALDFAAQLLAFKAAKLRVDKADVDAWLRSAAECIILADQYRKETITWPHLTKSA